jgi:hypothetical protein
MTQLFAAQILAHNQEATRAVEIAEELTRFHPYLDSGLAAKTYALACAGQPEDARLTLEQLEWLGRERYVMRAFTPAVYVELGDHD